MKVVVKAAGWVAERAAAQAVVELGEAKVGAGAVERVEVALEAAVKQKAAALVLVRPLAAARAELIGGTGHCCCDDMHQRAHACAHR